MKSSKKGSSDSILDRDKNGKLIRKAGIIGIVIQGGVVTKSNPIEIYLPPEPHQPLQRV